MHQLHNEFDPMPTKCLFVFLDHTTSRAREFLFYSAFFFFVLTIDLGSANKVTNCIQRCLGRGPAPYIFDIF
jgi:hypothetical protein